METIYHVAAETQENQPAEIYHKVNVIGTRNLLESFVENEGKKFLHTSAVGVYGYNLPNKAINEDYPKKAVFPYHLSKMKSEQLVFRKASEHGFFVSAIRPPMVLGTRDSQAAQAIFDLLVKGKSIPLINGGTKTRTSFVHVKDVARALIAVGEKDAANGEAFNVTSFATTQKDLFDTASKICGYPPKYLKIRYGLAYSLGLISEVIAKFTGNERPKITRRRVNQVGKSRLYDTSKIRKIVGFDPNYNLETSLVDSFVSTPNSDS